MAWHQAVWVVSEILESVRTSVQNVSATSVSQFHISNAHIPHFLTHLNFIFRQTIWKLSYLGNGTNCYCFSWYGCVNVSVWGSHGSTSRLNGCCNTPIAYASVVKQSNSKLLKTKNKIKYWESEKKVYKDTSINANQADLKGILTLLLSAPLGYV